MNDLIEFAKSLANYYPPEYISLWLILGLGVAIQKLSDVKLNSKYFLVNLLVGFPLAVLTGVIIIVLWPAYIVGALFGKISR